MYSLSWVTVLKHLYRNRSDDMIDVSKIQVTVWVYTSSVVAVLQDGGKVYLHPLEPEYMTQLTVPFDLLTDASESTGTAKFSFNK
jgi:hypothetical protein